MTRWLVVSQTQPTHAANTLNVQFTRPTSLQITTFFSETCEKQSNKGTSVNGFYPYSGGTQLASVKKLVVESSGVFFHYIFAVFAHRHCFLTHSCTPYFSCPVCMYMPCIGPTQWHSAGVMGAFGYTSPLNEQTAKSTIGSYVMFDVY